MLGFRTQTLVVVVCMWTAAVLPSSQHSVTARRKRSDSVHSGKGAMNQAEAAIGQMETTHDANYSTRKRLTAIYSRVSLWPADHVNESISSA